MNEFLTSDAVTVANLLGTANVLFKIPPMQRGYVWTPNQVGELMNDVYDSFASNESHYFIGGMVLAKEENEEHLLVIDGQQRLTTLMLVLSAARDVFGSIKDTEQLSDIYAGYVIKKGLDAKTGMPKPTYLLDLQGSDKEELNKILEGKKVDDSVLNVQRRTDTTRNLKKAKEAIDEFLRGKEKEDLAMYMNYFLNNVHVVRTTAADASTAFTIFEKLNGTGSILQADDLLKNLLLQEINPKDYEIFSADWQNFLRRLTDDQGRYVVQVSSFLKHYIMSQGQYVNKTSKNRTSTSRISVYDWFKDNRPKSSNEAKQRLMDLDSSAETYRSFIEGKGDSSIRSMKQLGFRQGFVVLLGSQNLLPGDRSKIAKSVETVAFCYVVTGSKTNVLEHSFAEIAALARQAEKDVNQAEKVQKVLDELKKLSDEKKEDVRSALMRFQFKQRGDKNKTLYVLSKLANALDGSNDTEYTIEHILPQNTDETTGKKHLVPMLGNLTLLKNSVNSSLQDKMFTEKREAYRAASWLTRSLVEDLQTGTVNTIFDRAISTFKYQPPAEGEDWTEDHIKARTVALTNLAMHVWFS